MGFLVCIVFLWQTVLAFECDPLAKECFTSLIIESGLTMRHSKHHAVYPEGGNLYKYDVTNTSSAQKIAVEEVITVDGWEEPRMVIVANHSLPGPAIIVYKGQTVYIKVINKLLSDTTSVHWHGLPQLNNMEMDGVAHVTQCPILPGQDFTYRFSAEPPGTFWYHSHSGTQRSQGLYGALIIREPEPLVYDEHIMVLQEWSHGWDPGMDLLQYLNGIYENRTKMETVYKQDGDVFGAYKFSSGLINGRGRYHFNDGKTNGAPLEAYTVEPGKSYRFRIISAASILPFRVSIDNHNITVIASDGHDLQPITGESVIIQAGERFDIVVHADQPVDNYWIRAQTLEFGYNHYAEAILRYQGSPESDPITNRKNCSEDDRCHVINCPFSYYSEFINTECIWFGELKAKLNTDKPPLVEEGKFHEHFLNFGFPGRDWWPSTINGRKFELPHNTEFGNIAFECSKSNCGEEKLCTCTHTIHVKLGDVVQLIFSNNGIGIGGTHPIHLHGYSFYVLKMGYSEYNKTTSKLLKQNTDIECSTTLPKKSSFCTRAHWSNSSWNFGNIPGLEMDRPPKKDTITLPRGGYVVTRIHANNPGLWLLHCHVSLHNLDSMALVLNVSSFDKPQQFPVCGRLEKQKEGSTQNQNPKHVKEDAYTSTLFWVVTCALIGVIVIQAIVGFYLCRTNRTRGLYKPFSE